MSGFKRYGVHAREDLHAADEFLADVSPEAASQRLFA